MAGCIQLGRSQDISKWVTVGYHCKVDAMQIILKFLCYAPFRLRTLIYELDSDSRSLTVLCLQKQSLEDSLLALGTAQHPVQWCWHQYGEYKGA